MGSLHDSLLVGYAVDGTTRTIVLHVQPHRGEGIAAEVTFSGCVAYHFEGDCFQNIVSDVTEVPIETVVGDGKAFAERHRQFGWPSGWDARNESAGQFLRRRDCHCFELSSSYGMHGWIAAERMEIVPARGQR